MVPKDVQQPTIQTEQQQEKKVHPHHKLYKEVALVLVSQGHLAVG